MYTKCIQEGVYMITISGVPIYKKYVINDDYTIGGKDYEKEDVKKLNMKNY